MNERPKENNSKARKLYEIKEYIKTTISKKWKKSEAYIYRRFSEEVEFSLTDITDIIFILKLSREEGIDIFFN